MFRLLIITEGSQAVAELSSELAQKGYDCFITPVEADISTLLAGKAPDVVLIETDNARLITLAKKIKREEKLSIIALLPRETFAVIDAYPAIDDFVIQPYAASEVELRIKRLLHRTKSLDSDALIKCGDLLIDLTRCEVSVSGKPVMLTFREYQLLKFLARNGGHVFTREALLNKVWGHDYYGGDRTVDVHIRRLRSKIEDSSHSFIETIRSIGYKFRVKYSAPDNVVP